MEEKNPKLYLNMIIKEDEPVEIVERSINSIKDYVNDIYITITFGDKKPESTHKLVTLLKKLKAHTSYFKWVDDFSAARQYALDQVPKGDDCFVYWQDADDVLDGAENLPQIVKEMYEQKQAAVYFNYLYAVDLDEDGNVKEVLIEHKRERIVRNDDTWKWIGDLHETLIEQKQENLIRIGRNDCRVIHLSNVKRSEDNLDRNIRILEKQMNKENRKDPRTLVYLGKSYFDRGKMLKDKERELYFNLAIGLFHEYLYGAGNPGDADYRAPSGWREERATTWEHVAEIAILQERPEVALEAYKSAIDEAPEFPNYYIGVAICYIMLNDYKKAERWLYNGINTPTPETTIITFPREVKLRSLQVSLEINLHKGELDKALNLAEKILKITPNDESAINNYQSVKNLVDFNKACQSVVYLGKYLEARGDDKRLANLVQSIPEDMQQEQFASQMRHKFLPTKTWADNEIAILCGPGFEKWSPKSIKTGLGGSEEAVIRLSKELAKIGWKVTVYADPGENAGIHDGVEYRSWYDMNPKDSFNVLILWRAIGFVDVNPKAKFTMLWLHDVPNNPDFTQERLDKVDKIAVLSEYHKSILRMHKNGTYHKIPDEKIFITSNGISDINITQWKGNSKRIIYASSPDRGLVYLLKNWPTVIQEVPDAELHIFYGFNLFDIAHKNNPAQMALKKKWMDMMKQKGIVFHGRVGQDALHYEFSKSGIWAYPTDFTEISCITAMKAQACGSIPVVTNYAALEETVKNGLKVDVDIQTPEGQKEYFEALIGLLKDSKQQEEIREPMMKWAQEYYKWDNVAKLWNELFKIYIQNPEKRLEVKELEGGEKNAI